MKRAVAFEHIRIDLMILDQDPEPFLKLGEKSGDRHRIEFGQRTEQLGRLGEGGDPRLGQAEHVDKDRPERGVDLVLVSLSHARSLMGVFGAA